MQNTLTIDVMIFGAAALLVAIVFLLVKENGESARLRRRIRRIREGDVKPDIEQQALSLRRKKDVSLGSFGVSAMGERLSGRLHTAGMEMNVRQYLLLCLGIAFPLFFVISVILGKAVLLGLLTGFVAGIGVPHFYVGMRINKRQKQFLRVFPDAIELIVRGLRAGLPVTESMQTVAKEIPDPVGPVFRDVCDKLALGVTLDKALADMAIRLDITEFNFFVISVVIQRETGGNLGEILSNLAEVLRQRHILKLKIRALSSEARASSIIVGSLPVLVLIALSLLSPDYMRPIVEDFRGNIAAFVAVCSLVLGMFVMARMARFQI